ncbi:MAG: AAA family ATPase [Pirellulales bacterium]|nr:AAA family ATPase [Pirellulales bacterium]
MYEAFYQLSGRPFVATALAAHYFRTASSEAARETTLRCVRRGEGPALVVGGVGIGKSIFASVIAQHLRPTHQVVTLAGGECINRRALSQTVLHRLGRPIRGDEGELRLALVDYISGYSLPATGLVLVIDDAQLLEVTVLEELRLLTNLVRYEQTCVHLVLAGNPEIEERLASPKLESFNQRLAARCYLAPFTHAETRGYIAARLAACDGRPERLFTDDAVRRLQQATDGVPRLVNQLCDHALVLGAAAGRLRLDAAAISVAWADLQQFPAPRDQAAGATLPIGAYSSNREARVASASTASASGNSSHGATATIEFGALDEDEPTTHNSPRVAAPNWAPLSASVTAAAVAVPSNVVEDPVHGRGHQFEQEEVVVDRYAQLDSCTLARRPKVQSVEGRILGDLLEPFVQVETPDHIRVVAPQEFDAGDDWGHQAIGGGVGTAPANSWTDAFVQPVDDAPLVEEIQDDDLIVIDDEANDVARHGLVRGSARRVEYEQLFAKLRRESR